MKKYNFTANQNTKVLKFLSQNLSGYKYSALEKALRQKDIIINGVRVKQNTNIKLGDKVEIYLDEKQKETLYTVVYQDDNIIVFNKKKGIEVCDGDFNVQNEYKTAFGKEIYAVHRIDRNTFGLVMFAKTKGVQSLLIDAFKSHSVKKYYYALVYGEPKESSQTLNHYLVKDSQNNMVKIYNKNVEGSVQISTTYNVVKLLDLFALLSVEIYAGKTHQIRAHLAYINLPILGDEKYGNTQINKQFSKRTQQLQAYKIEFNFSKENKLNYLNNLNLKLNCEIDTKL